MGLLSRLVPRVAAIMLIIGLGGLTLVFTLVHHGSKSDVEARARHELSLLASRSPTEEGDPRLVDLCDDKDAGLFMDGGNLARDRSAVGVDCSEQPPPDSVRYMGVSGTGASPFFGPFDLVRAKRWLSLENDVARRARERPGSEDQFSAAERGDGSCPNSGLRTTKGASVRHSVRADLDGDGERDRFITYAFGADGYGGVDPRYRAELADGSVVDIGLPDQSFSAVAMGATDLDRNGRSEIWINTGTANKGLDAAIVHLTDCKIVEVLDETEEQAVPFSFSLGGYPGLSGGIDCVDLDADGREEILEWQTTQHVEDAYGEGIDEEEAWSYAVYVIDGDRRRELRSGRGDELDEMPADIRDQPRNYCGLEEWY